MQKLSTELIQVDRFNQVVGPVDLIQAHRGDGVLHRAISVFLFRKNQGKVELLLQQRSQKKHVGPGLWANTVCGNVRWGELVDECALRRLRHELGIDGEVVAGRGALHTVDGAFSIQPTHPFSYFAHCGNGWVEREFDQMYVGWFGGKVVPNPEEVLAVDWRDVSLISDNLHSNPDLYAPWFQQFWEDAKTQTVLQDFIQ